MNSPFVSVVIPTYNRAECIKEAIDSVLNQSFQDFELIVVDDGSTDNTHEIVGAYGSRVNYLKQENHGAAHARNSGVKVAKGEWVAFLDSDDLWKQDKLKIQVEDISKYPGIVAHMVDVTIICESHPSLSLFDIRGLRTEFGKNPFRKRPLCDVLNTQFFTSGWMILHKSIRDAGFFNVTLAIFEDLNLLTRVALEGPFFVNCYQGVVIRRKKGGTKPLSDLYQTNKIESLNSLIETYLTLKQDARLNRTEYCEVKKRLGGVQCELFAQYRKRYQWSKGLKYLLRSVKDDPGLRSFFRAGLHLIGLSDAYGRINKRKGFQNSFRRSEIDFNS